MPTITISSRTGADFTGLSHTNLHSAATSTVFPGTGNFEISERTSGDYKHTILRIVDNTGLSGVTVSGATLGIYCVDNNGVATQDFALQKITASVNMAQATWNERSSGNSWAVAGCFTQGQSDATDVVIAPRATLSNLTQFSTLNFSGAGLDSDLTDLLNGSISELLYMIARTDALNDGNFADIRGVNNTTEGPILTVPYTAGGSPTVSTVTSNNANEGTSIVHTVTLSAATTVAEVYAITLAGGTATGGGTDYTSTLTNTEFSDGVTISGGNITVPIGVTTFTVTVPTTDDQTIESAETYSLTVGGVSGDGSITDNDAALGVMATQYTAHRGRYVSYGLQRGKT